LGHEDKLEVDDPRTELGQVSYPSSIFCQISSQNDELLFRLGAGNVQPLFQGQQIVKCSEPVNKDNGLMIKSDLRSQSEPYSRVDGVDVGILVTAINADVF
jgi:hypothetical protein